MTVYVITRGCYSDYGICAVSLDKKKAKTLAKMYSTSHDTAMVEEWETDTEADVNALNGRHPYSVKFFKDRPPSIYEYTFDYQGFAEKIKEFNGWLPTVTVNVYASDKDMALKIASDRLAKYLAEKEGIA